jgi:hypothetical protein
MDLNYEDDERDPAKWTLNGSLHGAQLKRSKRRWPFCTKLMADEILLLKELARHHGLPMNATIVKALNLLNAQDPVKIK